MELSEEALNLSHPGSSAAPRSLADPTDDINNPTSRPATDPGASAWLQPKDLTHSHRQAQQQTPPSLSTDNPNGGGALLVGASARSSHGRPAMRWSTELNHSDPGDLALGHAPLQRRQESDPARTIIGGIRGGVAIAAGFSADHGRQDLIHGWGRGRSGLLNKSLSNCTLHLKSATPAGETHAPINVKHTQDN